MTTTSTAAVETSEIAELERSELERGGESTSLSTDGGANATPSGQLKSRPIRHHDLDSDFEEFLFAEKVPLARALAAWLWRIDDFTPISSRQMEPFVDRDQLVQLVLSAAPWDDYFVAYASRPEIGRMRTSWYVAVGFGEPERIRNAAVNFLKFCRRQGLRLNPTRGKPGETRAQLDHAIHYLVQWQHQVARKLIGPILDRSRAIVQIEDFDDQIPF